MPVERTRVERSVTVWAGDGAPIVYGAGWVVLVAPGQRLYWFPTWREAMAFAIATHYVERIARALETAL